MTAYHIYLDQTLIMSTDEFTTTASVTGLSPATGYRFQVTSADAAGNESNLPFGIFVTTKDTPCGLTTTWIGTAGDWHDPLNWSLSAIPNACQDVFIPAQGDVTIVSGTNVICQTIEIEQGGNLEVQPTADFHAIPSRSGPFNVLGIFTYDIPGCNNGGNPEFNCTEFVQFSDQVTAGFLIDGGDIIYSASYTVIGDIIELSPQPNSGIYRCISFRILDNNTLIRIQGNEIWSRSGF